MRKGSYSLLIHVEEAVIEVGSLDSIRFATGFYAYNGSAFGSGGLKRVERHYRVFQNGVDSPHWHIDYLADHDAATLLTAFISKGERYECRLSRRLPGGRIEGFGCSDCGCGSHLVFCSDRSDIETALRSHHDQRYEP